MTARASNTELMRVLAKSSAYGITAQRWTMAGTSEEASAFVLDALQTCQLPRLLSVLTDTAPCLKIEVAGGRIGAIVAISDAASRTEFADVIDRPLRASDDGDVARIAALFRAVLQDGQRISVTSGRVASPSGQATTGIAPAQISAALDLLPTALEPWEKLDHLMVAAEEILIATHAHDGIVQLFSDTDLPPSLLEYIDRHLTDAEGLAEQVVPGDALFLAPVSDGPYGAAFLHGAVGPIALVFKSGACADLAGFWAELS